MADLPKYTLLHNKKSQEWDLEKDGSKTAIKSFKTKKEATSGNALQKAVGNNGSVKIQKLDGTFDEERTYPAEKDPPQSKG